jgi:REP element-mobilizing transposase RayT
MTLPRNRLISVEDTPYYHLISRCVRRTYLCGVDQQSGKSYEHRRQWIEDRIRVLSSLFAIEICAYAVMTNHIHLVVKINQNESDIWSMDEIFSRWTSLYKGPLLVQKWFKCEVLSVAEQQAVSDFAELYRKQLSSISWFMKCLNEPIARAANKEDQCTGHFWESRFKSQALLTEEALLSCMAYVDLNPVRAGLAETPESSRHTSIHERLNPSFNLECAVQQQQEQHCLQDLDCNVHFQVKPLLPFEGNKSTAAQYGIPFSLEDYLELIDYTGRAILDNKRGSISAAQPPILQRLHIDTTVWFKQATQFEMCYHTRFAKPRQERSKAA